MFRDPWRTRATSQRKPRTRFRRNVRWCRQRVVGTAASGYDAERHDLSGDVGQPRSSVVLNDPTSHQNRP